MNRSAIMCLTTVLMVGAATGAACVPNEIKIVGPDKPIEINLNIKIDQEIRVKLEKDVQDIISSNPDIF